MYFVRVYPFLVAAIDEILEIPLSTPVFCSRALSIEAGTNAKYSPR
jgi:hypothetical protein